MNNKVHSAIKIEKVIEFAERIRKAQEEVGVVLRKVQEEVKR